MVFQRVQLGFADNVAVLTLNHPEALNAVSVQMLRELTAALGEIEDPGNGARCLILTGAGRGFCAGAHLADPESNRSSGELKTETLLQEWYHPILLRLRDLRMPIITAVNGPAAGVGMSLAMMGDIVIAARSAYFLQAFRRIGLIPDGGSTFLLPRKVGWSRAMELSMLAGRLPAEKALEWGLVNRVVDDGQALKAAMDLGRELAAGPHGLSGADPKSLLAKLQQYLRTTAPPRVRASDRGRPHPGPHRGGKRFFREAPARLQGEMS